MTAGSLLMTAGVALACAGAVAYSPAILWAGLAVAIMGRRLHSHYGV